MEYGDKMKISSIYGICAIVILVSVWSVSAADFGAFLEKRAGIWSMSVNELNRDFPEKFRWLDKKQAHAVREKNDPLTLYGDPLQEVTITLDDKQQINLVVISIYNRGDAGEWNRKQFEEKLELVQSKLNSFTNTKIREKQTASLGNGAKLFANIWRTNDLDLVLKWSSSNRKEPEYITLELLPAGKAPRNLRASFKNVVSNVKLSEQVKTDSNGSRYLEIPMVDQGAKGYCVAATVERVLRYYGLNIDQHVIAQLAESDAEKGTSLEAMVEALEAADSKLGVNFKRHYQYKLWMNFRGIEQISKEYNSIAKRMKKPQVKLKDFITKHKNTVQFQIEEFFGALDPEVYTAVRMRDKNSFQNFLKLVRENIDNGVPLCWGVIALAGQKGGSESFMAHMRIINGYNPQSGDIIYTDSWGMGHEKKQMTSEEAWAITNMVCSLSPRSSAGRNSGSK